MAYYQTWQSYYVSAKLLGGEGTELAHTETVTSGTPSHIPLYDQNTDKHKDLMCIWYKHDKIRTANRGQDKMSFLG